MRDGRTCLLSDDLADLVQAQVVLSSRANTSHAVRDLSESVESLVGLNLYKRAFHIYTRLGHKGRKKSHFLKARLI